MCVGDTQPRQVLTFRISGSGISQLDEIAARWDRPRGYVIRRFVADGIRREMRQQTASSDLVSEPVEESA